jgi:hypothetical protein
VFFVFLRLLEDVLNYLLEDCDWNSESLNWSFELLIYSFYSCAKIFINYFDFLISLFIDLVSGWILLIYHVLHICLFLIFFILANHLFLALLLEIGKSLIQRGLRLFLLTSNIVAPFRFKDLYPAIIIRKLDLGSLQILDTCILLTLEFKL